MCDCISRMNDVMSSTNVTNFISFPSTLIPFIRTLLRIEIGTNSRTMIKRDGESGSPCRTPRLMRKLGVKKTLLATQLVMLL